MKSNIQRGLLKRLVEMLADTDEPLIGEATILTMVKLKDQSQ